MSQKRINPPDEMSGREKKKLKMSAARTIAVQPASNEAGPSRPPARFSNAAPANSLAGLPSAIDVEKFIEARAFEIDAMQTAINTASASSTHRVWQTLPRHLRRRAASHDVRRVPLRLRDRARAEMDPAKQKSSKKHVKKPGKNKVISRTESFLKRQKNKSWLETHIWHAKRMHMEDMWGYRLAVSPTEKSYRPSHRASVHGAILHDASYYPVIELKGELEVIITILELCCDPQGSGPASKRALSGSRAIETYIYKPKSYPYDLIAPLTIIWKPQPKISVKPGTSKPSPNINHPKSKKGKEKESIDLPTETIRSLWIRFHPSAHTQIVESLKEATSLALEKYKMSHGDVQNTTIEFISLKGQLNFFELMGPKSNQIIKGALSPVATENREDFKKFWSLLTNLQSAGSIPRSMVIGFKVNDPRLKFPPKTPTPDGSGVSASNIVLPSATLASSEIWDETTRNGLAKPRYKKKDIDARRSQSEIPGTKLNPLRQDDRIPLLLIQRSLEMPGSPDNQGLHGWMLAIPAGWSMAFFNSLIFSGTRVGGQLERQTQAFEAGTTYFPRDYPFSTSYHIYASEREEKEKQRWEKRPPAKRVNYEKLGVLNPWRANWHGILGIAEENEAKGGDDDFMTTQREPMDVDQPKDTVRPWLLRGVEVSKILSSMFSVFNSAPGLLSDINRLRLKRNMEPVSNAVKPDDLLKAALINVRITMCSRGSPQDMAAIYSLSDDAARQWERVLLTAKINDGSSEELLAGGDLPSQEHIIGYITTGHYSLARGSGFAIGAIALSRLLDLEMQITRLHINKTKIPPMLVAVRNSDSQLCRAAHLEVLFDA